MRSSPGTDRGESRDDRSAEEPTQEQLTADLQETRAQLAAAEDRYLRALADLDNYRKRAARDLERRVLDQQDDLLRAWLEVVDSVDRALAVETEQTALAEGLRAVLDQMETVLARRGVARMGEVGQRFDPELHEAIAVIPDRDRPPDSIADVARSGYTVGDRVLRPAQVAVARPPADVA
jgi:molecular chaperone GrpE